MVPSVGRIVHYRSYGTPGGEFAAQCRAAIVTEVDPNDLSRVGLCAINPTGVFFHSLTDGGCAYDGGTPPGGAEQGTGYRGGTWHWPERTAE